ncbi:MAG: GNAT family N-acetyltransferase [Planctomycetaceae bacterium]
MTTVHEINDPHELAALRPIWDELFARTPGTSFFHSLTWLQVYWKHFGARQRLRVLVVYEDEQAIGIVPLVVRTSRRSEPVKVLTYPLDENDWANYYRPIGPDPLTTLTAALNHVRRTPRDWHILELSWIDELTDEGRTKMALDKCGLSATCEAHYPRAIIDLRAHGSWKAFCASRSGKWRNDLDRQEKKLARRGAVSYVRYRPSVEAGGQTDPRWDLYEACEAISRVSWQGSVRGNMLNREEFRGFYRDMHLAAVCAGFADLNLLRVDDQPVAFCYGYQYRGNLVSLKTAYDPAYRQEGAGTVVQARALADSIARGDREIDLGSVRQEYKRRWLTHTRAMRRYVYFPPGAIVAQVVRAKRAIERRLKDTVRRWRPARNSRVSRVSSPVGVPSAD